jgi:LPXTG-site transpeptidase (sortase) family protein
MIGKQSGGIMKDQPPQGSPHHGPPILFHSDHYWIEGPKSFPNLASASLNKLPSSLVLIVIGILVYTLGFGRLVATALDSPSPIDQIAVSDDPDLGFVPYLVSNDPLQADQDAPAIPDDQINFAGEDLVQDTSALELDGIRRDQLVDANDGLMAGEAVPLSIWLPNKLIIPKIDLEAPIDPVSYKTVEVGGKTYEQWYAPDSPTVGWHQTSAQLGSPGNTILNGHHNIFGEVFKDLNQLEVGDRIMVQSGQRIFEYVVGTRQILPERYQPIETRLENARWIQPSSDERITLITCWPYESNTHRVIVVAVPVGEGE